MDWTVKVTDLAIVFATLTGPFLAVYVTERQRKSADARNRKIHIFRTLMATRAAFLAGTHIEALNLVELEFAGPRRENRHVVDSWKLYKSHLNDHAYPSAAWPARRKELMVELLYSMSLALGYSHEKADINTDAYYPVGYSDADQDSLRSRKLWLEVLEGKRPLPMRAEVFAGQNPTGEPPAASAQPPTAPVS